MKHKYQMNEQVRVVFKNNGSPNPHFYCGRVTDIHPTLTGVYYDVLIPSIETTWTVPEKLVLEI